MKEGIDVSVWQGLIDWTKVKTDFCYVKTDTGINAPDQNCLKNAQGCVDNNITFGYYHFATLNSQDVAGDAIAEANWMLNHLKSLPQSSLAIALDVETNDAKLSPENVELWISTFVSVMESKGLKVILYSGLSFLNENLNPDHSLGNLPLWIAEYTNAELPILPKGWSDYAIWQYNSQGKIFGIGANVDLNHAKILHLLNEQPS